ncbi:uncharacterized protein LOC110462744 [Mizuhopecten yessoensis]|uniref:Mitochondrial mRNA-processing protein COX24 C-terminal domain-containing protein n=1 Tax=Mizuhopecten yessoensis TaxID=6573 RepID=A0A210PXK1_MIZYE|nr:uncharacterized protein LOC110462744 [Mizuhopecten yessoensis]OWF41220.1 hypothetical protein KP79_PYT21400 [Mizuhopecten yessoensis]
MAARAIISVGRLCSKLRRVSIATSCKHGHAASMSTHTAGFHPPTGPGLPPGVFLDVKEHAASDSGTRSALNSVSQGLDIEYKCPSLRLVEVAILDITNTTTTSYDCPNLTSIIEKEIILPSSSSADQIEMPTSNTNDVAKQAKNILKIRKRMRKKHKLRKWRKLRESEIRKELLYKLKKREARREQHLESVRSKGEVFDANTFMENIIQQARRGGYRTNLFEEKKEL